MIRFNCSSCGKLVEVADQHGGKKGKCPHCQTLVDIPQASAAEAPAAEGLDLTPAETAESPPAWYYAASGQRHGPTSASALAAQIQAGQLPPTVQVWRSGMGNWAPANTVAELPQLPGAPVPAAAPLPGQVAQAWTSAPQGQAAPRNCRLAIAALVLGLIPCLCVPSLLAIIFGHIALSRIVKSQGQLKGRDMAVAGLVLGYIFTVLHIIYFIIGSAAA